MNSRLFPAKILLFGEYTILLGSKALAIPFPGFSGKLAFSEHHDRMPEQERKLSNMNLKSFLSYIYKTIHQTELSGQFEIEQFRQEVDKGLMFHSMIPVGYGLGSSGALTAAVYERYIAPSVRMLFNLPVIRKHLGYLESYFHLTSSGTDPLISYSNQPLVFHKDNIEKFDTPEDWQRQYAVMLLDTLIKRRSGNLVRDFLRACRNSSYLKRVLHMAIASDDCIDAFLEGNNEKLFRHIQHLSEIQYMIFRELIPPSLLRVWEFGLKTGKYFLKLCGAGGGGYLLGFSRENKLQNENNELHRVIGNHKTFVVNS